MRKSRRSRKKPQLKSLSKALFSSRQFKWMLVGLAVFGIWLLIDLSLQPDGAEFRVLPPTITSLMRERVNELKYQGKELDPKLSWRPLADISPNLIRAVLVAEDVNFFSHRGFDLGEVYYALKQSLARFKLPRGASTLTQQLAKNLYLSESRNPIRKLREAVITSHLESSLGKRRILELYLNVIEWGPGIFGAEAASRYYFGKSALSLSNSEAARLAAIIPNPRTIYNPSLHPQRVALRQNMILRRMDTVRLPKLL